MCFHSGSVAIGAVSKVGMNSNSMVEYGDSYDTDKIPGEPIIDALSSSVNCVDSPVAARFPAGELVLMEPAADRHWIPDCHDPVVDRCSDDHSDDIHLVADTHCYYKADYMGASVDCCWFHMGTDGD
jgi:hypothetical protein